MWTMLGIAGGCLILVGGMLWFTYRLAYRQGKSDTERSLARSEAERRAEHAEMAARPMSREPFTGPGGVFDK